MKNKRADVITFYSFKGGVGRSMALANLACLIADREEHEPPVRVLVIDWDLEAPGLHEYFADAFEIENSRHGAFRSISSPGVIDLFEAISDKLDQFAVQAGIGADLDKVPTVSRRRILVEVLKECQFQEEYVYQVTKPGRDNWHLDFIHAGKQDAAFAGRVSRFRWRGLHEQVPWLYSEFAQALTDVFGYEYVFIDSRTGHADIASICTSLLPSKLAVVCSTNRQSIDPLEQKIEQAVRFRRERTDDQRPLAVFPLISRIDLQMDGCEKWIENELQGCRPKFEEWFHRLWPDAWPDNQPDLIQYFKLARIPTIFEYTIGGESIAVLGQSDQESAALPASYNRLRELLDRGYPWEARQDDAARRRPANRELTTKQVATVLINYIETLRHRLPASAVEQMAQFLRACTTPEISDSVGECARIYLDTQKRLLASLSEADLRNRRDLETLWIQYLGERLDDLAQVFRHIADDILQISDSERASRFWLEDIMGRTETSIWTTNIGKTFGRTINETYLKAQKDASNRGVRITRVFVIDPTATTTDDESFRDLLLRQRRDGAIRVRGMYAHNFAGIANRLKKHLKSADVMFLDEYYVYVTHSGDEGVLNSELSRQKSHVDLVRSISGEVQGLSRPIDESNLEDFLRGHLSPPTGYMEDPLDEN